MNKSKLHLQGLKYQLSSHFLFNVLNTVRALTRKNTEKATAMITLTSEYLRYALHKLDHFETTLGEEKTGIGLFLDLQAYRFHDNIIMSWNIPENLLQAKIPSFLLQPLVELVYKKAAKDEEGKQQIALEAFHEKEMLILSISCSKCLPDKEASGAFVPKSDVEEGVEQVHHLLHELYGDKGILEITETGNAKKIQLQIPYEI